MWERVGNRGERKRERGEVEELEREWE